MNAGIRAAVALFVREARHPVEHPSQVGVVDGERVRARRRLHIGTRQDVVFDVEELAGRIRLAGDTAPLARTERDETGVGQ